MTRRNLFLFIAAFVAINAALTRPVQAAPIHVFGSGSQYGTVNSDSGAYTPVGRLTDSFTGDSVKLSGFAFGASNTLLGVTGIDGAGGSGEGNYLWQFDASTGVSTDRRDLPVSLVTIARRPGDGQVFGYANDAGGNGSLYQFDTQNFNPSFVGTTGVITYGALTFDNANRLYLADSFTGDIYRVNAATAQATVFAATGVSNVSGMAVVGDSLYLFSTDERARYRVSLDTGETTFAGNYNIGGAPGDDLIYGAAIAPTIIPEIASGWLFAGTLLLVKRRRQAQ